MSSVINAKTPFTPQEAGYNQDRLDALDKHYQKLISEDKIQCALYALSRDNKFFAHRAMGKLRHYEDDDRVVSTNSIRRLASVTKTFTATAIMKLFDDGLITLLQPVCEIIKEFDNDLHRDIRIHHLLTHTSGLNPVSGSFPIPYRVNWWQIWDKKINDFNWIEAVLSGPLHAPIGTERAYCNEGFMLLGEIITRVSGMFAHDYIMENIVKPLGMNDTYFDVPKEKWDRLILTHDFQDPQKNEKNEKRERIPDTGGGISSTVYDLMIFGQMLLNKGTYNDVRILGRKTVEKMTMNSTPGLKTYTWGADEEQGNGLGLGLDYNMDSTYTKGTYSHEGWGRSGIYIDHAEKFVVSYLVPTKIDWEPISQINARSIIWSGLN